jgi:hypothetical protein
LEFIMHAFVLRVSTTVVAVIVALLFLGCSSTNSDNGFTVTPPDASVSNDDSGPNGMLHLGPGSGGCTGLQCQQTCADTTISGTVYDPAGVNGLYNVYVYVPNAPLDPIPAGPTCTACQAPASGSPITSTSTLSNGSFKLTNVPVGTNIPVVLQLGKWRKVVTVPSVGKCDTVTPPDGFFHLPKLQGGKAGTDPDDNIPLIAFTTGCDGAECFFADRIGIDLTEFTGPGGGGRVHIYQSANDDEQVFPGINPGSADALWASSPSLMMNYDIVFDACECMPHDRGGAGGTDIGYINFLKYLNAGGRAYTTHYFYNFYANEAECSESSFGSSFEDSSDCYGQGKLPSVGEWEGNQGEPFAPPSNCPKSGTLPGDDGPGACLTIDTSIPKGAAFAEWYRDNNSKLEFGGGEAYGYVGLVDIREDMGELQPSLAAAGTATPWLYAGDLTSPYDAYYFSINTPIGTNAATQCGRAIFSDVHVSGAGGSSDQSFQEEVPFGGTFPNYCVPSNRSDHAPNELALEFLFFDLSSCVQNDKTMPTQPPSQ